MSTDEITVKPGEELESIPCSCCGGDTRRVSGSVYRDGDVYSLYNASWSPVHPDRGADVALEFGDWSEGTGPGDRFRVGMAVTPGPSGHRFAFVDPSESAWASSGESRMLSREGALEHPGKEEILRVAEHVLRNDRRIRDGIDNAAEV
jgi:hypothetical protein